MWTEVQAALKYLHVKTCILFPKVHFYPYVYWQATNYRREFAVFLVTSHKKK